MQQGIAAAANIMRDLAGKPSKPFRYLDKGTMAVIGRIFAVTEFHGLQVSPACSPGSCGCSSTSCTWWATATGVIVLINWAWSYLTFKRGARLITMQSWKETAPTCPPCGGPAVRAAATAHPLRRGTRSATDSQHV